MFEKEVLNDVYIGLGSNLGDKGENMRQAINNIEERIGEVKACSAFYITEPMGFESKNQFLNAVCLVQTKLQPLDILKETQLIEKKLGRDSKSSNHQYKDRTIDLDFLLFDGQVFESAELTIPHPHMHERAFVLYPLSEIAGDVVHPIFKKTVDELKAALASE